MNNPSGQHDYSQGEFKGDELMRSPQFPELNLTINCILAPPIVEELISKEVSEISPMISCKK